MFLFLFLILILKGEMNHYEKKKTCIIACSSNCAYYAFHCLHRQKRNSKRSGSGVVQNTVTVGIDRISVNIYPQARMPPSTQVSKIGFISLTATRNRVKSVVCFRSFVGIEERRLAIVRSISISIRSFISVLL